MQQVRLTRASKSNVRAYLQGKLADKWKLLVEITGRQSQEYETHIQTIKGEAEGRIRRGVRFMALKAWARDRRAALLK